ncbi:hypothetical protein KJ707_02265 [Patescibacteria group bacterium]|nr:hypothetical protein [Patescibacteria group bacterium]
MNELPEVKPLTPAEIAQAEKTAEGMLSPERRAMSRVRAGILAPMPFMNLPEDQAKIIREYAEKAGDVALSEFERLQKESPIKQLLDAFADELALDAKSEHRALFQSAIAHIGREVQMWQADVAEAQGLALIQGENKPLAQIVVERINLFKQLEGKNLPQGERVGFRPIISNIVTEWLEAGGAIKERMATAQTTERILRKLGFIPDGVSLRALFALPDPEITMSSDLSGNEELNWAGKPVKISSEKVVGLQSVSMPGVAAQVQCFGGNRVMISFEFKPEAVVRSVATIPAVTV